VNGSQIQHLSFREDVLPACLSCGYAFLVALTTFFLPLFLKDHLGFSGAEIGMLYGALSITGIVFTFPIGFFNDRLTPRALILCALVLTAVSFWGQGTVTRFLPFFGVFLLFGFATNIFRISLDALLFKSGREVKQGFRYGLFNCMRMVGFTLGALCAGFFLSSLDFPLTLKGLAFLALILVVVYPFLPSIPGGRWELFNYRHDFVKRRVIVFSLWLFFFSLHWGAEATSFGLFLRHNLNLSLIGIGCYMAGEFFTVAVSALFFGWFYDRNGGVHAQPLLYGGLIASGIGNILMVYPDLIFSFSWRVIHGIGDGIIALVMYLGIRRLFHLERIGGNASLISMSTMIGIFVGSLIFGPLGEKAGYGYPLAISGIITILILPLLVWSERLGAKEG
jgi:MFS family permease